ncbi:hypothetical protein ACNHUS_01370 [Actinomycetes bacterium M1A6_2h]
MTYIVETCGTAVKIVAAAIALTAMLVALPIGMTASAVAGLATAFRD